MVVLDSAMLLAVTVVFLLSYTTLAQTDTCSVDGVGLYHHCPAASCVVVFHVPGQSDGYYWVKMKKATREVYCSNRPSNCGKEGVWMRVGHINTGYKNVICPGSLLTWVYNRRTYCRTPGSGGCASVVFDTNGVRYTEVCGMARGYQYHTTDAFEHGAAADTPDDNYADGVSFTYGASPRKHLWTFAAGVSSNLGASNLAHCPCSSPHAGRAPPPFVVSNYYCESAHRNGFPSKMLYTPSPLWDGRGTCEGTCCESPNMPWFRVVLNGTTTENTEMRLCTNSGFDNEAVAIDQMELYVRVG